MGLSGLLVLLGLSLATGKVSYKGHQVYRILVKDHNEAGLLQGLEDTNEYDFWTRIRVGELVDVRTSPQDAQALKDWIKERDLDYSIMIEDVGALMELEKGTQLESGKKGKGKSMDWISYHDLEDIYDWFDYLEDTFEFCEKEVIGQSYEGQDMIVMKVCRGGCGKKPAMWIDSGIHPREWISPAVGTYMLNELVENDETHPELTKNLDWYFLPSHNPDGYRVTRNMSSSNYDRMWRKTTSQYPGDSCRGTDPNRNWGSHWGEPGASSDSCSENYHGPKPFSEVEVRNVRDFISAHKENIKYYQTIHSYGQLVLMALGYYEHYAPGHDPMLDLAYRGSEAIYDQHHKTYVPRMLDMALGGTLDWVLGVTGIPYAYAMELRGGGTGYNGFILPPDEIIPTGEEIWAFHMVAAHQIITEFGRQY